ncbi:MAG: hypothetical protein E4G98_03645 [Promethearchaeota archaeon]|nr:MAG: hypothetical protein E4G98_03645 [Candidatus Lokiarchaeota archaeon]
MGFNSRNPLVIIFGLIIIYVIGRKIWLEYGRVIPYFGIAETVVVLGVIIICTSITRIHIVD